MTTLPYYFSCDTARKIYDENNDHPKQPGEAGYWQVWGATVHHVQPGDLMMSRNDDGSINVDYVEDVYTPKNHPLRWGFIVAGKKVTLGAFTPITVMRPSTHNLLAK